jgi:general secretion pathway protein J
MSPASSAGERGFTLLEILVSLVVLGLLVVGLTQGVRAGLALWQAQSRRVGETAEIDAAARTLRGLLNGIAAPPSSGAAAGAAKFNGDQHRLSFIGELPTGLGTSLRADIDLELAGKRLVLSWTPHRHEVSSSPPPKPIVTELIGGVYRFDLAYWGATAPDQPVGWQTRWDGPQLPDLVRVRLGFAKGDRRRWPDLIAAPMP